MQPRRRSTVRYAVPASFPNPPLKLTLPMPPAGPADQSNKVYLTPCAAVPSISFGWASDKRYSLGLTMKTRRDRIHAAVLGVLVCLFFLLPLMIQLIVYLFGLVTTWAS